MKKLLLLFFMLLCCFLPLTAAYAEGAEPAEETVDEGILSWLDRLDLTDWETAFSAFPEEVRALFGTGGFTKRIGAIAKADAENAALSIKWDALISSYLREYTGKMLLLLGAALLSAVAKALSADGEKGVSSAAAFVVRCIALTGVLSFYLSTASLCIERIQQTSSFLEAAFPVLITLLTAIGGAASSAALTPSLTFLVGTVFSVLRVAALPLATLSGILAMLDKLFEQSRLMELSKLAASAAKWIMGAVSAVFVGSLSVKALAASAFDNVTIQYAKYAAKSLVPIVGGMVSGTMDSMLGCALLVKSGAGIAALSVIAAAAAHEMLRLLAAAAVLRLCAAVSQPIADEKLVALYGASADALFVLIAVSTASFLALLALAGTVTMIGNAGFAC